MPVTTTQTNIVLDMLSVAEMLKERGVLKSG